MKVLIGTGVALITPFNQDKSIDFNALEGLIEFQIAGGSDYLVVLGTTGETATLSASEKEEIFNFVAERAKGRIPLVAGIGGNNTKEVAGQIRQFASRDYVANRYHQPSDELEDSWNFDGMIEDAQLGFYVGLNVANADEIPAWTPGDEFEAARKQALADVASEGE